MSAKLYKALKAIEKVESAVVALNDGKPLSSSEVREIAQYIRDCFPMGTVSDDLMSKLEQEFQETSVVQELLRPTKSPKSSDGGARKKRGGMKSALVTAFITLLGITGSAGISIGDVTNLMNGVANPRYCARPIYDKALQVAHDAHTKLSLNVPTGTDLAGTQLKNAYGEFFSDMRTYLKLRGLKLPPSWEEMIAVMFPGGLAQSQNIDFVNNKQIVDWVKKEFELALTDDQHVFHNEAIRVNGTICTYNLNVAQKATELITKRKWQEALKKATETSPVLTSPEQQLIFIFTFFSELFVEDFGAWGVILACFLSGILIKQNVTADQLKSLPYKMAVGTGSFVISGISTFFGILSSACKAKEKTMASARDNAGPVTVRFTINNGGAKTKKPKTSKANGAK